uniref:Late embryogenesis abundant protein LEA-2 subgroup domain-containing protein n=2 Tax=Aegilops tauschii TaxID=37682 RepID=A0A453T5Q9_AEGTS
RKMSDIKYIIASEADNGEHTRFPCLAVVRCAAATGVTVLALAVIAMVIHAVLRSEDIRLSVNDGYIGADNLRSQTYVPKTKTTTGVGVGKLAETQRRSGDGISTDIIGRQPQTSVVSDRDANIGAGLGIGGYGYGDDDFQATPRVGNNYGSNGATRVVYQRANTTNLRVILIANNPGGRTKIDCNDTTVSVIDMQSPTSSYEIGTLKLDNFTVPPQTTITLQKRLKITDPAKLSYIWDNYGGEDSFSVVVRVSASVTSYPLGKKTQTETRTYICRLVTLGLIDHETYLAAADRDCIAEPQTLASAPAPAPVPAR